MIDTKSCILETKPADLDITKWQSLTDMIADLYDSASGVIVQFRYNEFNVVSTSHNPENFLTVNASWHWDLRSFCRRVIETDAPVYENDPANCPEWSCAAPVASGPVRSYLGYPLYWPDGSVFGTICAIDTKKTDYSDQHVRAMDQLKRLVESELQHLFNYAEIQHLLTEKIDLQQLMTQESRLRKHAEEALHLQEAINSATLSALHDAVIRIDETGVILAANKATEDLFGYQIHKLVGQNISVLMPDDIATAHDGFLKNYLESGEQKLLRKGAELPALRQDGSSFIARIRVSEIKLCAKRQYVGLITDITDQVKQQQALQALALYDPLTGCANRHLLEDRILSHISRLNREPNAFSLIYLDLNQFKPINDRYGHQAGDQVLVTIAQRLSTILHAGDLVARIGGDEFVIVFDRLVNIDQTIDTLSDKLFQPITTDPADVVISGSFGFSCYPQDGTTMGCLLEAADKRMYQQKRKSA